MRPFNWLGCFQRLNKFLIDYIKFTGCGDRQRYPEVECLAQGYVEHVAKVKAAVPANRLLIFNVKEGWEPLCKFLNLRNCPTTPFPRVNDRAAAKTAAAMLSAIAHGWMLFPLLVFLLLYAILRCLHRAFFRPPRSHQD
eukprot:CAMPEP_0181346078 /NCGR_PEP_ID=MMETSP1101-20121128/33122_1 /TAXON_ID=46948 /ORGANISM="Rhodomonas abbreviata, Strain Caron Lab Isolate" /LENGTH=138 /DNA_ID=CAMNT_0023458139 /DNA_START=98 /DNA_END=514 /DNA_ORIENTATION=-